MGDRSTHGVIHDFFIKIKNDKKALHVLGDGNQLKPYMYVDEIVDAIYFIFLNSNEIVNEYNIGPKGLTKVSEIASILLKETERSEKSSTAEEDPDGKETYPFTLIIHLN